MISEVRLANARVFAGTGWQFPLQALTVLCGTNSAGKSTILKSLLLLKNNITTRPEPSFGASRLRFRVGEVDLGSFKSFVSHRDANQDLGIGISFWYVLSHRSVSDLSTAELIRGLDPTIQNRVMPYLLHCDFNFISGERLSSPNRADSPDTPSATEKVSPADGYLQSAQFRLESENLTKPLTFSLKLKEGLGDEPARYVMSVPKQMMGALDTPPLFADPEQMPSETIDVPVLLRGLLPDRVLRTTERKSSSRSGSRSNPMPLVVDEFVNDIREVLGSVSYIGPLRAPAQRYYHGELDEVSSGDSTGKGLPQLLRAHQQDPVSFAAPLSYRILDMTLEDSLDYWLHYFRTGQASEERAIRREIDVGSIQDVFLELNLRSQNGQESHALADSGFGYSQILPILMTGLLLNPGSTLTIEQPEVHLNPALQARMTEFLLSIAVSGGQIIVETHSEHLVDYLRARTAEHSDLARKHVVMILYLETQGTLPEIKNLCISDDGSIPDWPDSFFGEQRRIVARILRAQRLQRAGKN